MANVSAIRLEPALDKKLTRCREILRRLGSVVVAYSGGVDSSLLLAVAAETLGREKVLAAMAVSTIFPQRGRKLGRQVARQLGVKLLEFKTPQLTDTSFTKNPTDRCYYCKSLLLSQLKKLAEEKGFAAVITGANADDAKDGRPGSRAEQQMGIRRPLQEAGLVQAEVRLISREMNLPTWNAPAAACLATRIPYGQEITHAKLARIEQAEEALRKLGFSQFRLRDHDPIARLEVPADKIAAAARMREKIVRAIKAAGYTYVALDLQGYRSGSMNEALGQYQSES